MLVVYAGAANADAMFAAAAADPESDLEALACELTSKCLNGADSCCCESPGGSSSKQLCSAMQKCWYLQDGTARMISNNLSSWCNPQ
jgi:hypothetical protein